MLVRLTISGPMMAARTPPAMTNADGAGSGLGRSHLGRGEAQMLRDAEAETREHGADAIELEIAAPDAEREGQAAKQRANAAEPEPRLAAEPGEHDAGRDRGRHRRRHLDGHRQRVERLVHRERMADQRRSSRSGRTSRHSSAPDSRTGARRCGSFRSGSSRRGRDSSACHQGLAQ